jgi:hypothetical protein
MPTAKMIDEETGPIWMQDLILEYRAACLAGDAERLGIIRRRIEKHYREHFPEAAERDQSGGR